MRHRVGFTGVAVALLLSTALWAFPLQALAKCAPPRTNTGTPYNDGWEQLPGSRIGGLYSTILNYSPWVTPQKVGTLDNYVTSLVLIYDFNGHAWGIGWEEFYGGARDTAVYWTDSNGEVEVDTLSAQATGTYSTYTVLFQNTQNEFTYFVNGNQVDDAATLGYTPTDAINDGQILTPSDQMPGGSDAGEYFKGTNYYYSGGWKAFNGTVINRGSGLSPPTGNSKDSSTVDEIWDWSCAT